MIDKYEPGRLIKINGMVFHNDVKIIDDNVKGDWWRKQGHRLDVADIKDILASHSQILVIGTGYAGQMKVPQSTLNAITNAGFRCEVDNTNSSVHTFNRLRKKGYRVAGAFHLTC